MPLPVQIQPGIRADRSSRGSQAFRLGLGLLAGLLGCLRLVHLRADFPNFSPWAIDQAKYTDEGWWASAAVRHRLFGYWNLPGDYNPAVAVPVWPASLDILFRFTGVSLVAARALSVAFSLAALAMVFLLVRRYRDFGSDWAPTIALLLLASSPFAFVYSRLAILDTFVVFQFCLLLWIASYAGERRIPVLGALAILMPIIVLTKTTALVLLPAVGWIAWSALKRYSIRSRLVALALVTAVAGLIVRAYIAFVFSTGHEVDYREFYDANSLDPIDWTHAFGTVRDMIASCMWVGRIVCPLAAVSGIAALIWLRDLWKNPLFTACWLAVAGQFAFLFATQGSYAPRYFLPLLIPFATAIALTFDRIKAHSGLRAIHAGAVASVATVTLVNISMVGSFLVHPTFEFYHAAVSVAQIVRSHPDASDLVLGVSAADLSVMTGLPSISDVYGTVPLTEKVETYHPGWYLAWNSVDPGERQALQGYDMEQIAAYPAFDDDERNRLILYRLMPAKR